jgi:hypothetical protein
LPGSESRHRHSRGMHMIDTGGLSRQLRSRGRDVFGVCRADGDPVR